MSSNLSTVPYENDLFANLHTDWAEAYQYPEAEIWDGDYAGNFRSFQLNPVVVIVVAVLVGIIFTSIAASLEHTPQVETAVTAETAVSQPQTKPQPAEISLSTDSLTFVAPYKEYAITQGIHGASYGHMAIDIAAGRGEALLSPINGIVTQLYMDEYGNPTVVIENDAYAVMFLHGDYTVAVGDVLKVGQQFGTESNKGYTMDMAGNLCYNREWCGNHSHLNVFDKRIQANVNPLTLISNQ